MESLKEYVRAEFFELSQDKWSDSIVKEFIQTAANRDTDVHEAIKNVDTDDLIEIIAGFDLSYLQKEIMGIQSLMVIYAKAEIQTIIDDIQYAFDQEETESQLRRDFERAEGAAINRSRRQ